MKENEEGLQVCHLVSLVVFSASSVGVDVLELWCSLGRVPFPTRGGVQVCSGGS